MMGTLFKSMHDRPMARSERLVVQRIDDELVVYDQVSHQAHCLSAVAAAVWGLCDGERSAAQIADELRRDVADVDRAVDELRATELLEDPAAAGISRRDAAKRLAQIGGAAFAAPLVYSVAIGPATAAASGCQPQGTSVTCGTTSGKCNAAPGAFGTVLGTGGCTCYKDNNSAGCVYTTSTTSCAPFNASCQTAASCCSATAACSGAPSKKCTN
jgi:Coenzyme PQQ synthesis protein D (PqqD)